MNTVKKICKLFTSITKSDYSQLSFQDLPLEIIVKIFSYLSIKEIDSINLRNECRIFRLAVAVHLRDELQSIHVEVRNRTKIIKERMVAIILEYRVVHPGVIKSLQAWRSLQTDLVLLKTMVWRYRNDIHVWSKLSGDLVPLVEELRMELDYLKEDEWKSNKKMPNHEKLVDFMKRFTQEIEVHFFCSNMFVPFELRLLELLFSCPCGNLQMIVRQNGKGCFSTDMYFDLRNFQANIDLPKVSDELKREENEREILCFLRDYIRTASVAFVREFVKQIKRRGDLIDENTLDSDLKTTALFITSGDELLIQHSKIYLGDGSIEELYEATSTMNLGKCGMCCSFEIKDFPLSSSFGDSFCFDSKIKSFHAGINCVACTHENTDNYFTLEVTSEKTNHLKEFLLTYESKKNNYSLTTCKHNLF